MANKKKERDQIDIAKEMFDAIDRQVRNAASSLKNIHKVLEDVHRRGEQDIARRMLAPLDLDKIVQAIEQGQPATLALTEKMQEHVEREERAVATAKPAPSVPGRPAASGDTVAPFVALVIRQAVKLTKLEATVQHLAKQIAAMQPKAVKAPPKKKDKPS